MTKKALVTGGAGFIGSHLVEALLQRDYQVTVLDNLSTGKENNLPSHRSLRFIAGDVRDKRKVSASLRGCDVIFHLAAMVSVEESILKPVVCNDVNVNGTLNLLEEARRKAVERLVYASSTAVYGNATTLPVSETASTNPFSPYGLSKLVAEKHAMLYHRLYNVPSVCLRFFNVFGPRQTPGYYAGVIANFVTDIETRKPLTIFGDGNQTRDFVYVSDAVDACMAATEKKEAIGEIINIGTGRETRIEQLAREIIKISGRRLKIRHRPERRGEIRFNYADITKAKSLIGYSPGFTVIDGLRRLLSLRHLDPV